MTEILVLGDGLLGSEIVRQSGWHYISRKKDGIDFTDVFSYLKYLAPYDQVINCIGYTDTYSEDSETHWDVNYKGVVDLVDWCDIQGKKLIYISTDYIYSYSKKNALEESVPSNCPNWYTYTKLLADGYVQLRLKDYLLIRCSFKPRPFPYRKAINQWGNFEYVDEIASKIIRLVNKNATGVFNVGSSKSRSMGQFARESDPRVVSTNSIIHRTQPLDVSMDTSKMRRFLDE